MFFTVLEILDFHNTELIIQSIEKHRKEIYHLVKHRMMVIINILIQLEIKLSA